MTKNNEQQQPPLVLFGSTSFTGTLTLVFVILKLTDVIDWSWFWVLSPLWISASLFIGMVLLVIAWLAISDDK